jgi:CHAD domain-containing protein
MSIAASRICLKGIIHLTDRPQIRMSSVDHRAALLLLLKQRLTTLVDAMPAAQAGDMRSVHQARVASRRLREALPVLRKSVNNQALSRVREQVRQMTRALGPVRELDVALGHLEELSHRSRISSRALGRVRQAMARERLTRRREMLATITPGKVEKLRQRLGQVSSGPERPQPATALEDARTLVARRARRLAGTIANAGGLYLADRLHGVRVAAKKLRYAMEIERELTRSKSTARILQLKRLQDLLGRMHDYEILIDRTRGVQAELAGTNRDLSNELDTLVRALEAECRKDHAIYMRRRSSILRLCDLLAPTEQTSSAA